MSDERDPRENTAEGPQDDGAGTGASQAGSESPDVAERAPALGASGDEAGEAGLEADRLEHTLESILEDEPTHAITGKHPAPPPSFDSLPRSMPTTSLRRPAPPTFPPPARGPVQPAAQPISITPVGSPSRQAPVSGALPPSAATGAPLSTGTPKPSSGPPLSVPPLSRSNPPRSSGIVPGSGIPSKSVPPPGGGPLAPPPPRLTPKVDPLPVIADDAPTLPGRLEPPGADVEAEMLEVVDGLAPPPIPVLLGSVDTEDASEPKDRGASRRRGKAPKKNRRSTVRIPDDRVPTSLATPVEEELEEADLLAGASETPGRDALAPAAPTGAVEETPTSPTSLAVSASPADATLRDSHSPTPRGLGSSFVADEQAIFVLRPIEVVSDMPPVPPSSKPSLGEEPVDELVEEIEPERMSVPGEDLVAAARSEAKAPPPRLPPARTGGTSPAPASNPSNLKSGPPPAETGGRFIPTAPPMPAAPPAEARKAARPRNEWWTELFEDDFALTLDPPEPRVIAREVSFIEKSFGLPTGARVLDVGCGHGAHAVELASRGYALVAVDLSSTMLDHARTYADQRKQTVSFVQGDMRQFELDAMFDGVFAWTGTFGYFDEATNLDVLTRLAKALKPGGKLLLDLPNRDFIAPRMPSTAWFSQTGCVCMDEARFDFSTSVLTNKRMVLFESGRAREIEFSMRLYTATEIGALLTSVGLQVVEVSGDRATRGAYFGAESPRLIVLAEKG